MKLPKQQFNSLTLEKAIAYSEAPTIFIQPFLSYKESSQRFSVFQFTLLSKQFSLDIPLTQFLSEVCVGVKTKPHERFQKLSQADFQKFYSETLQRLFRGYMFWMEKWIEFCRKEMRAYVATPASRYYWELYKLGALKNIPRSLEELRKEQLLWLSYSLQQDKIEQGELISGVLEALKPWLNLELYQAQEKKKTTRENSSYEETKKRLLMSTLDDDNLDEIR